MTRSTTLLATLAVTALLAAAGCSCEGRVTPPGGDPAPDVTVTIVAPLDGASIDLAQDINPAISGVQIDVLADVTGLAAGDQATLTNSAAPGAPPISVTVASGRATFAAYTPELGLNTLTISASNAGGKSGSASVTIHVSATGAVCFFVSPTDNATLTADADSDLPFFQTPVLLQCQGELAEGDSLQLSVDNRPPLAVTLAADLSATFSSVTLAEGVNHLVYGIRAAPPTIGATCGTTPGCITVTVDTGLCSASLSPIDGTALLFDDDNNLDYSDGLQYDVRLTTDCSSDAVVQLLLGLEGASLALVPATPLWTPGAGGTVTARFDNVSFSGPSDEHRLIKVLAARLRDGGGALLGEALPSTLTIDGFPPVFSGLIPAAGTIVTYQLDAATEDGLQIQVYGQVDGLEPGQPVQLAVAPRGGDASSDAWIAANLDPAKHFVFYSPDLLGGEWDLVLRATDLAGNSGGARIPITVDDRTPTVTIVRPLDGSTLNLASDLSGAPHLQTDVTIRLANFDDLYRPVGTLIISGEPPFEFLPDADADNTYRRTIRSSGDVTISAVVEDEIGNLAYSPPVRVRVDQQAPVFSFQMLAAGTSTLVPSGSAVGAGVSAVDLDLALIPAPGDSFTVRVQRSGPGGLVWQLSPALELPGSSTGQLIPAVPLVNGANLITVNVTDRAGNATVRNASVALDALAPPVAFAPPLDGSSYLADALDDADPASPGLQVPPGGFFRVLLDGDASSEAVGSQVRVEVYLDDGGGALLLAQQSATFSASPQQFDFYVGLPDGDYDLIARGYDEAGNMSQDVVRAVIDAYNLDVRVTSPAADSCASPGAFALTASIAPTGDYTCELRRANNSVVATQANVTGASVTFSSVGLADGQVSLYVRCSDGGTALGDSQLVPVYIDNADPVLAAGAAYSLPAPGSWLNTLSPDSSSSAGLQGTVQLTAPLDGGASEPNLAGLSGVLSLVFDPTPGVAGGEINLPAPAALPYPAADPRTFTFSNVTLVPAGQSTGELTVSFRLVDCAGNLSAALTQVYQVDLLPPTITQTSPLASQTIFTADDDSRPSTSALIDLPFSYRTSGVADGSSVALSISPPPDGYTAGQMPLLRAVASNNASFGELPFADGFYVAQASVADAAGNPATSTPHNFEVQVVVDKIEVYQPANNAQLGQTADLNSSLAGLQYNVYGISFGYPPGSQVKLCTDHPEATGEACASSGGYNGRLLGTVSSTGTVYQGQAAFSGVTLAEGAHHLYMEIATVLPPLKSSLSLPITATVDTIGPELTAFDLLDNNTDNDSGGSLGLRLSEGVLVNSGTALRTRVQLQATGTTLGRPARVYSNNPAPNTLVGQATFTVDLGGGLLQAAFNATLSPGAHSLTARAYDLANNASADSAASAKAVIVDFTPGTLSVAAAGNNPYTSAHGVLDDQGTPATADDTLTVPVQVFVSDNRPLAGGAVQLYRDFGLGTQLVLELPLTATGTTQVLSFDLPLLQGADLAGRTNRLRAVMRDALRNPSSSLDGGGAEMLYNVDYLGPQVSLAAVTVLGGSTLSCTQGAPCDVDILDPASSSGGRIPGYAYFDYTGADGFRAGQGTDLRLSAAGCPCTIRLRGRRAGSSGSFSIVLNSAATLGDSAGINYAAIATAVAGIGPGFLPSDTREVYLEAWDANDNLSATEPLYLRLDYTSQALITVERRDANSPYLPNGLLVLDRDYFGPADNVNGPTPPLLTNLQVQVDGFGALPVEGATLTVMVDRDGTTDLYAIGGAAELEAKLCTNNPATRTLDASGLCDLDDVRLAETVLLSNPHPNRMFFTLTRDGTTLGVLDLSELIGDLDGPTFEWLRDGGGVRGGLAEYQVPYTDPSPGITGVALWNARLDDQLGDAVHSNGMNTNQKPLVLRVNNVEPNQLVSLATDQSSYPLAGNTARTTNCAAGLCEAIFGTLSVPSLPGNQQHNISVSVTDRAGNAGSAPTNEVLAARVDTIEPAGTTPLVCLGEDTVPYGLESNPPAPHVEPGLCSQVCATEACDRLSGTVALRWLATGDDGNSGRADHYVIGYKPLGQRRSYLAACADIVGDIEANTDIVDGWEVADGTTDPGQALTHTLAHLPLHWDYCIAVQAVDDAGNASPLGSFVARRALPLRSWPRAAPFDGLQTTNRDNGRAFFPFDGEGDPATPDTGPGAGYGRSLANLGDLNGDGLDDIAIANPTAGTNSGLVHLFLSSQDYTDPDLVRSPDHIIQWNTQTSAASFGSRIASIPSLERQGWRRGDLNGDGLADLVITAPLSDGNNGSVWIYFGFPGSGINPVISTVPQAPSIQPDTTLRLLEPSGSRLGIQLAAGNVNGDALIDLAIGSLGAKAILIYTGRPSFPTGSIPLDIASTPGSNPPFTPDHIITGSNSDFPSAVALGDFNADGVGDVAVSSGVDRTVYIFYGPLPARTSTASANVTIPRPSGTSGNFGSKLFAWPAPSGSGSWLFVHSLVVPASDVVLFRALTTGIDTANPYVLSRNGFSGALAGFGYDSTMLGDIDLDGRTEVAFGGYNDGTVLVREIVPTSSSFGYTLLNDFALIGNATGTLPYGSSVRPCGSFLGETACLLTIDTALAGGQAYVYR